MSVRVFLAVINIWTNTLSKADGYLPKYVGLIQSIGGLNERIKK